MICAWKVRRPSRRSPGCSPAILHRCESAFSLAYSRIGVSPDSSSSYFLPRMIGLKRTFEMMYLSGRYTAEEAREMGMVTRVVPNDEFDKHISELALKLANGPTYAYARGKALLNASFENSLESQVELEADAITDCMMTDDHIEGITAFTRNANQSSRALSPTKFYRFNFLRMR